MAQKIKGITIEIGGDTTKLGKALESVNTRTKELKTELKGVNSLLKLDPSNVTLLKQKQDILNQSIANTREKLNTLKEAQIQVQAQFDKGEVTEEQYRDFQREIVATETKLKSLTKELKNFGSVGAQQVAVVGEKIQNVGGKIESVGKKVSVASAGTTAALVVTSKAAIDFESAFAGVTKTVDGTEEQLEKIKQGILDLSEVTASSSTEIAAVAEAAGQLGIKTEDILSFTKTIVELGDSTNLSAEEAASALAKFANVMGTASTNYDKLGSTIVDLGNNFATTESDIVAMATRLSGAGATIGLSEANVLSLATALSSVGIEAEMGGSAMSKAMIDMAVAVETGAGSYGSLADYAKIAKMSTKEFSNTMKNDAISAITAFILGLGDTESTGKSTLRLLDELGFSEVRLRDTMLRATNASDIFTDAIQTGNKAWEENSALTNEATKRYQTTASKITQMKNTITELCVKLGNILLPIIQSVINAISRFTNWLTNLNPAVQKVVVAVLAIVSALGPFMIILAKLITSFGTIMTIVPKIVTIIKTVKTAFSAFNATLLANPIVLVVAAITALVAGFVLLWNKCEGFRNFWINLWENIKNICKNVIDSIVGFFTGIIDFIKNNWQSLLLLIVNPFAGAFKLLYDNCEGFRDFIDGIIQKIKEIFSNVVSFISTNVIEPIKNFFAPLVSWFTELFMSIYNSLVSVINVIWGIIQGLWEMIVVLFTTAITWINENVITPIINAVTTAINNVKTGFQIAWEFIKSIFVTVANWINDNVLVPIMNIFTAIWQWLQSNIITPIKDAFISAWESLKTGASNAWEGIKNVFSSVATFFGDIFSTAWEKVKNVFSTGGKIFDGIKDSIVSVFTTVVNKIIGGINTVVAVPFNTINGMLNKIRNIEFLNIAPFKDKWKENPLSVPQIPLLRTGGAMIGNGQAIMAEAGSPELITMMNGKAIVRPLTSTDRKQVINNSNSDNYSVVINNNSKYTSPAENARLIRNTLFKYKLKKG